MYQTTVNDLDAPVERRGEQERGSPSVGDKSEEQLERFAALLGRVATDRDREAFSELFAYYAPRLKGYMLRLGADAQQAEKMTLEVMMAAWRTADGFDPLLGTVSAWIFCIARNYRVVSNRDTKDRVAEPYEGAAAPIALVELNRQRDARAMERHIRAGMRNLSAEQLDTLKLALLERKSLEEIAALRALSIDTVRYRIRSALRNWGANESCTSSAGASASASRQPFGMSLRSS